MKSLTDYKFSHGLFLSSLLVASLTLLPSFAFAGSVALASAPMVNATPSADVLPNLMVVFDDSGSMESRYLPDLVGNDPVIDSIGNTSWAFRRKANAYNNIYYDPSITYSAPALFDSSGALNTTTYPSMSGESAAKGADATKRSPNWNKVRIDAYGVIGGTATTGLTSTPISATSAIDTIVSETSTSMRRTAYVVEPGEYCKDHALKDCTQISAPTATYKYPAPLRWCNTAANALLASPALGTCQGVYVAGSFKNPRFPSPRQTDFTVTNVLTGATVTSIKVDGKEILSATVTAPSDSESAMAALIVAEINKCNGKMVDHCTVEGFAAVQDVTDPSKIILTAGKGNIALPVISKTGTFVTSALANFKCTKADSSVNNCPSASTNFYPGYNLLRVITPGTTAEFPYPGASTAASSRTDCAASLCTGNEEMTNFANWYAYYQSRNQSLKTAISLAFKDVDARYRIGMTSQSYTGTTDGSTYLHIDKYELAHKNTFLTTLFKQVASGGTPTRAALTKVGKLFAKKVGTLDPVQYSCQKNYAFVATDGYWNGTAGTTVSGAAIPNMDGGSTARPYYEGPTASAGSLADVAKYYYDTDLRTAALGNCTGGAAPGLPSGGDVCDNSFGTQTMTTFALALGIAGKLDFTSDYRTATSGDYYNLKKGLGSPVVNWPDPNLASASSELPERIDDLWHAAVNSDGIYFSAKSPTEVVKSLREALADIDKKIGSGSAAATSTLQPVSGDNYAYVASYTTMQWSGNLEARTINTETGEVSKDAVWCVEDVVEDSCSLPSTRVLVSSGSSTSYVCRPPSGADVEIASSCSGVLKSKVADFTDTRTIYMSSGSALQTFSYANISAKGLNATFDNTFLRNNLSQRSFLTAAQLNALSGDKLVAYLRGQFGYDLRPSNPADNQLFRLRGTVLGDIVESQAAYLGRPMHSYLDAGYDAFKSAQASRSGTVYVGANDGMLHAFDSATGNERWAFVPTPVIPNLWRLADDMYSTSHRYYVNGSPYITDIYDGSWKTILVAGLNAGGRGYYALDITNPAAPVLLWEFTSANDPNLGFTFGGPVITKLDDGTWVALLTSGYNNGTGSGAYNTSPVTEIANSPAGDGMGYLYVLNAKSGALLSKISTGAGSSATPSGLSKIAAWVDKATKDNTATYVYGGDLLGNLWRFDINDGSVFKLANLNDGATSQPITVRPELGLIKNKRVVFVGTGKYLEQSDLANTDQQTIYAISDNDATATLTSPRDSLVKQTLSDSSGTMRVTTNNAVDYSAKRGWYVDLTDSKERQNVDAILVRGLLLVPTTVPESTVCSPGGYSWLNCFDYETGGVCNTTFGSSLKVDSVIVGINVLYISKNPDNLSDKTPVVSIVTAKDPTPDTLTGRKDPFGSLGSGTSTSFSQKKAIWRELIQ